MAICSAPGKLILFGEHAVVFGEPALSIAVDLRISTRVEGSDAFAVNGQSLDRRKHRYVKNAIEEVWRGGPLELHVDSSVPAAAGLGSSAAISVSTLGALLHMQGEFNPVTIAQSGFQVELKVQGNASPIDTTTSTHGGGILVERSPRSGLLWSLSRDEKKWFLHDCPLPDLSLVVGNTGVKAETGPLVLGVKKLAAKSQTARDQIKEIGRITLRGKGALQEGDLSLAGELMNENHKLLNSLGVGHPALDKLISACEGLSYGAKLTGAGGGGSMVALTDEAEELAGRIREAGGEPFIVRYSPEGVRLEV
ncbi:MAG: mevalonate kinase [Candidatus Thermoplasmatota archaeon]|nr:mevalonate kinase [Candidatus Thermoplasmatota archaeon]